MNMLVQNSRDLIGDCDVPTYVFVIDEHNPRVYAFRYGNIASKYYDYLKECRLFGFISADLDEVTDFCEDYNIKMPSRYSELLNIA